MVADAKAAFEKKVALQKSSGVMPKVPKSLSEADLKLLYYSTTSTSAFAAKPIPETISYADIHNIGKKDTKFFKYRPSTAPFWPRSMCRYVEDYQELPLGDSVINKALASTFAPMKERKLSAPSFEKATRYKEEYHSYPTYGGPPKPFKPANPLHVDLDSKSLEKKSRIHDEFPSHNDHLKNPEGECIRPSRWELRVQHPTLASTRYAEDFCSERPVATVERGKPSFEDESFRTNPGSIPNRVRKAVYNQHDGAWPRKGAMDDMSRVTDIMRDPDLQRAISPKKRLPKRPSTAKH
jgi:hypothetical protein